jgi:transposase InsO family protein
MIMGWIDDAVAQGARQQKACQLIGLSARTVQRWRGQAEFGDDRRSQRTFTPPNKLPEHERQAVLKVANSAEFGHLSPNQIVPRLADRGEYLASESTFYRLLRAAGQLQHRRGERPGQHNKPKAYVATGPNQLYSWDITYLPSPVRGQYFYLYLFLDLFSRKIVGWSIHAREDNALAAEILNAIYRREGLRPGQVVLHSDNGGPMKGVTMLKTLENLGVIPSFSRPSVSDDNPFSEALFKTLKYCPHYPRRPFADLDSACRWMATFATWYNEEHRHSAIRYVTPEQRHRGEDIALLAQRQAVYAEAKARHPQRWAGTIRDWSPILEVHLNPAKTETHKTSSANKGRAGGQACQGQDLRPGVANP